MSASYPLVKNRYAFSTRFGVSIRPSRVGFSPISTSSFLMRSCICLLYISAFATPAIAETADALYADRTNLASATKAVEMWAAALAANPKDFDAAWKLSRGDYWLGAHTVESEQRRFYEDGIEAGQKAIMLQPNKP